MNAIDSNFKSTTLNIPEWPMNLSGVSQPTLNEKVMAPRLLLVDDDPLFSSRMARIAKENHLMLSTFGSVEELQASQPYSNYDVAILDYYLGNSTATDILPLFKDKLPVILISESAGTAFADATGPSPFKRFVSKNKGIKAILEEALKAISPDATLQHVGAVSSPTPTFSYSPYLYILGAAIICFVCSAIVLSLSGLLSTHDARSKGVRPSPTHDLKIDPVPLNRFDVPIKWDQAPVHKTTYFG